MSEETSERTNRVPPQSLEAEQSVLGAMLLDREAVATACEMLKPDDFYREVHRWIFEAMEALFARTEPVDLITLSDELQRRNQFERVGGGEYLQALAASVPTAKSVALYAEIVRGHSQLRQLIKAADDVATWAYEANAPAREILNRAEARLFSVTERRVTSDMQIVRECLADIHAALEAKTTRRTSLTGLSTGLSKLDDMTSGLQKGDLFVIAARPSMGKTSLALNMAVHIALRERFETDSGERRRPVVAVFSLEMSRDSLIEAMLCSEALVDAFRARTGNLRHDDWGKLGRSFGDLHDAFLWIDDSPGLTSLEIRAKARRLKARYGLDAIFVDYLQRMSPDRDLGSEHLNVGAMTREMKTMARELQVPVVLLSQLSRRVEQRPGREGAAMRPMLSDLLASGYIEAEADVVAFIYRPEYYRRQTEEEEGGATGEAGHGTNVGADQDDHIRAEPAEIIIGKHRNGPTGTVTVGFWRHYRRFVDAAPAGYDPQA